MKARSSFVIALAAWPLPLLAVSVGASGRHVAAAAAWTGFVGLGSWSVARLLGWRPRLAEHPLLPARLPPGRGARRPVTDGPGRGLRPPLADWAGVRAEPGEASCEAIQGDATEDAGGRGLGPGPAATPAVADAGMGTYDDADDHALDVVTIAAGLARLEAFANGLSRADQPPLGAQIERLNGDSGPLLGGPDS
jgi:hypothetical protein